LTITGQRLSVTIAIDQIVGKFFTLGLRLARYDFALASLQRYARRGRIFDSEDLRQRFGSFTWYRPISKNPDLNAIEQRNVTMISRAEQRL
jgi:hypothetical protein